MPRVWMLRAPSTYAAVVWRVKEATINSVTSVMVMNRRAAPFPAVSLTVYRTVVMEVRSMMTSIMLSATPTIIRVCRDCSVRYS